MKDSKPLMNRWLVVVGAILIQLCLGAIYAWSAYTSALTAPTAEQLAELAAETSDAVEEVVPDTPDTEPPAEIGDPAALPPVDETVLPDNAVTHVGEDGSIETSSTDGTTIMTPDGELIIQDPSGATSDDGTTSMIDHSGDTTTGIPTPTDPPVAEEPEMDQDVELEADVPAEEPAPAAEVEEEVEPGLFGFTKQESQWPFSIGLLTFALVMILAGNWQKKVGPKIVAMTGGAVLGAGYILAGLFGDTLIAQVIFLGLIGGAGIGLAYVCPIAVGVKWFPDMKGVITGLAVAGFGFGALIWVKLAGAWGGLIEAHGVKGTWLIFGIIYLIAVGIGSIWMVNPPDDYVPKGWTPPPPSDKAASGTEEFDQWYMLKTPQFYMIWFCFIAGALAGLMVIGVIKLFGIDALQVGGMSATEAAATAGTAMAVFYALANGIGRIAWGAVSDKLGRKMSIFLMCLIQGIAMLTFFYMGKGTWGLWIWAAVIGFNFGGNFALYPAATADFFGNKNVGVNYGWMFTAYGVGGLVGPQIAGYFRDLAPEVADITTKYDAWSAPFMIGGILSIIAAVVILVTKKPRLPEAK